MTTMRLGILRLVALLLAGISITASAQESNEVLNLDQTLAMAFRANRTIRISTVETQKYDDQIAALRTHRLPSMSISALGTQRLTTLNFLFDKGVFGSFPGIGPVPATDTSIKAPLQPAALLIGKLDQPLSQQFKIGLQLDQLRLGRAISSEQLRIQKHSVTSQVKRLYYGILQSESALASVEESIKLYRELDRLTAEYVAQQVALPGDSMEVKTRLAKAEYDALTLRNPLATQKEQLNSLIGRDISTAFSVSPVAEVQWVEVDLSAARKLAAERRPEIQQARLKSQQAVLDWRVKKAEYIPDISLAFNYFSPLNFGKLIPSNIVTVGILVDWEPFDWGRKKFQLSEKDRTRDQAEVSIKETEDQVAIDVSNRFRKLQESRQLLNVTRLGQDTARERLRVISDKYKQESALLKDVLQMQAALADANNQYQQALLGFWTAKADFEKALGEDQ